MLWALINDLSYFITTITDCDKFDSLGWYCAYSFMVQEARSLKWVSRNHIKVLVASSFWRLTGKKIFLCHFQPYRGCLPLPPDIWAPSSKPQCHIYKTCSPCSPASIITSPSVLLWLLPCLYLEKPLWLYWFHQEKTHNISELIHYYFCSTLLTKVCQKHSLSW